MISLRKYAGLLLAFFRASLTADLEFRANIMIRIGTDILWYLAQISTFEVLFRQTPQIGSWTLPETRVFLGILFVVDGIYMFLFSENLDFLSEKVRKGDLDLLLAKPVNSQFMMSCQRMSSAYLGNLVLATSYLVWSYSQIAATLNAWNLLWLLLLIPCGLMIDYCGRFFFSVMCLIFTRAENIQYVWYQLYRMGMRPDSIYKPWLRYMLLTLAPVAMIASVPARAILYPTNPWLFLWTLLVTVFFVFLTTRAWRYGLSKYSSASS